MRARAHEFRVEVERSGLSGPSFGVGCPPSMHDCRGLVFVSPPSLSAKLKTKAVFGTQ